MKRIIRLTESELTNLVRQIIKEEIVPSSETIDYVKKADEFVKKFQGKYMNFYLPEDNTLPVISKFMCNKVTFNSDGSEIYFEGEIKLEMYEKLQKIELMYVCDGTNLFTVYAGGFFGYSWEAMLRHYLHVKNRTKQRPTFVKSLKELKNKYPRPLVEGGIDSNGVEMIKDIQDFLCSTNKSGRAVPKAEYTSTGGQSNRDMA